MPSTFRMIEPPRVADRFAEAAARLAGGSVSLDPGDLQNLSALLMCGEFERVRSLLVRPAPAPALPLAVAWYHAWSGDLTTVIACFDVVRDSLELVSSIPDTALQRETWTWLERTATDVGDPVLSAALVRRARASEAAGALSYHGAAATVNEVVHGLLGVEPDAHRGRIRLRPRIAAHDSLLASGLRFADGAVTLAAQRTGELVTFSIEQDAGAMPFTALLEPILAAAAAAEVDGQPARLDIRPHEHGVIVPVQLVLDERRTLALQMP